VNRVFIYIISVFLVIDIIYAGEVILSDEPIQECNETRSISKVYYISDDTKSYKRGNLLNFWNKHDAYIGSTFEIKIYATDPKLLDGCTDALDWVRYSEVAPGDDIEVVAFGADCIYHKPTDRERRTLQFHYITEYADINSSGREDATKYYAIYDESKGEMREYTKKYTNYYVSRPIKRHISECLNIELRYCGDGIVDPMYGEECDPNAESLDLDIDVCDASTCLKIPNYTFDLNFTEKDH